MITDREIDRVARALTEAEPSGALRARVMQQIAGAAPRRFSLVSAALLVPAFVVLFAGIAATYFWMRSDSLIPAIELTRAITTAPAPRPETPAAGSATIELVRDVPAAGPSRVIEMSAEERAWQARRLPALPQVDALALDPIQPEPLTIAPISVDPIVMDPAVAQPLGSRAGDR